MRSEHLSSNVTPCHHLMLLMDRSVLIMRKGSERTGCISERKRKKGKKERERDVCKREKKVKEI